MSARRRVPRAPRSPYNGGTPAARSSWWGGGLPLRYHRRYPWTGKCRGIDGGSGHTVRGSPAGLRLTGCPLRGTPCPSVRGRAAAQSLLAPGLHASASSLMPPPGHPVSALDRPSCCVSQIRQHTRRRRGAGYPFRAGVSFRRSHGGREAKTTASAGRHGWRTER